MHPQMQWHCLKALVSVRPLFLLKEPQHGHGDASEDNGMESRGSRLGARSRYAFLSGPCRAIERRRYRERTIRRTAQHDEERQDTGPKRALRATRPGHSPQLRLRLDGAALDRVVLGRSQRKPAPADHRKLWA